MYHKPIPQEATPVQEAEGFGRITGREYRSALFDELHKDSAAHMSEPQNQIPPRIYALISRAFERAHAGEFKT